MINKKIDRFFAGLILVLASFAESACAWPDPPSVPDPDLRFPHTCYAKYTCFTLGNSFRVPGSGYTMEEAKANALNQANIGRNYHLSQGHSVSSVTEDPPCDSPGWSKAPSVTAQSIVIMHSCRTKNGNPKSQATYGPRSLLDSMSELLWNRLAIDAAADGGMVPGTWRTRIEPMNVYFAYQTMRSKKPGNIHREFALEGRGGTKDEALLALAISTNKVIVHLASMGEYAQKVESPRELVMLNQLDGTQSESAAFRCETNYGPVVFATEFGFSKNEARAAAKALAEKIATDFYGGATTCVEIEPHHQP